MKFICGTNSCAKRGRNDELSETLDRGEKERSHAFQTMFQFIDADEGRLVNGSHLNGKNGSTRQNLMVQPYPFSIRTTRQLSERAVVGAARLMLTLVATHGRP